MPLITRKRELFTDQVYINLNEQTSVSYPISNLLSTQLTLGCYLSVLYNFNKNYLTDFYKIWKEDGIDTRIFGLDKRTDPGTFPTFFDIVKWGIFKNVFLKSGIFRCLVSVSE